MRLSVLCTDRKCYIVEDFDRAIFHLKILNFDFTCFGGVFGSKTICRRLRNTDVRQLN